MNQEHRYSLTRVCLRRGELSLPRSLKGMFTPGAPVTAVDSTTGTRHELQLEGDRVLKGVGGFFREHSLDVNDTILIRPAADGSVTFTPQKREERPDYSSEQAADRIITSVLEASPVTEAEARALLKGLPHDFDLAGLLRRSGRFRMKGGRWHDASGVTDEAFERQVDEALSQAATETRSVRPAVEPAPAVRRTVADTGLATALKDVGFQVRELEAGFWLLDSAPAGSTSGGFRVVMHQLEPGVRLDWATLLERRRQQSADYLAVAGPASDLQQLKAPAELAHATLWADSALQRLAEVALNVPLGPVDLESHFRHDGLSGQGLERFERDLAARIAERGAFSTVLANLAQFSGPASFRLEDATRGVDRDATLSVLDQLSRSPFQLVLRREGGEWYLRQSVQQALTQLAEYATSLQEQFPRASRQRQSTGPAGRSRLERA